MRLRLTASALCWSLLTIPAVAADSRPFVRLGGEAFGDMAVIEVPAGVDQEVIREAFRRLRDVERLTERRHIDGRTVLQELNEAAGSGPQKVDAPLLRLLARAREFCLWSEGKIGPLGGAIYDLWELGDHIPRADEIARAVETAECSRLAINLDAETVAIQSGSRIDLRHFAAGHAIDEAVTALQEQGVATAAVAIGPVVRAYGSGPAARSWPLELPAFASLDGAVDTILLADHAVAWSDAKRRFSIGQESFSTHLNHRTGRPAPVTAGVVVVSEHAVDAFGLAHAMYVMGSRIGEMYLGALKPTPSVLWVLSPGGGPSVSTSHNWSRLRQP